LIVMARRRGVLPVFNGTRKPTIPLHFTYLVDKYSRRLRFLFFIMSWSSILVENAVYVSRIILLLFLVGAGTQI
jgi:hypothetical protein